MNRVGMIDGAWGKQLRTEESLKNGDLHEAFSAAKELPDGKAKTVYLREIIRNELKNGDYTGAIDPAQHLPDEEERLAVFDDVIAFSLANNRVDWAMIALRAYPAGNRLKAHLDTVIRRMMETDNLSYIAELVKLGGKKPELEELERALARNLTNRFRMAEIAADLIGRKLTDEEIILGICDLEKKGATYGVGRLALMLSDQTEKIIWTEKAISVLVAKGFQFEARDLAREIGRILTNEEEKTIFSACLERGDDCHAFILSRNEENIPFLQAAALSEAKKGNVRSTLAILQFLPVSKIRNEIATSIAWRILKVEDRYTTEEIIKMLPVGKVKSKLTYSMVKQAWSEFSKCDFVLESDIKKIMEKIALLPKGVVKGHQLGKLLKIAMKREKETGDHGRRFLVTHKIVELIDKNS